MTDLPVPEDSVFAAAQSVFEGVEQVKELLSDPQVTSARLVVNPEKMVIDEARRTYTYLGLFGYGVDGVVVNRVLPDECQRPLLRQVARHPGRSSRHRRRGVPEVPRLRLRLFDDEMVGIDALRQLAVPSSTATRDPIAGFHRPPAPSASTDRRRRESLMEMHVPFVGKEDHRRLPPRSRAVPGGRVPTVVRSCCPTRSSADEVTPSAALDGGRPAGAQVRRRRETCQASA
jgi:arsenite/tail-anchored protein-transporting ATPase